MKPTMKSPSPMTRKRDFAYKNAMRKEITFPFIGDQIFNMIGFEEKNPPCVGSWIVCVVTIKDESMYGSTHFGIYKWKKSGNPKNIGGWSYINPHASSGPMKYIEDPDISDEKVILIRDAKHAHLKINYKTKKQC